MSCQKASILQALELTNARQHMFVREDSSNAAVVEGKHDWDTAVQCLFVSIG